MVSPTLKPHQLRPAPLPARLLARPRLLQRLAAAVDGGCVVLLQAPLGYGKSTLLAQYLQGVQSHGGDCAWLRLSTAENQPVNLLLHLQAALGLQPQATGAAVSTEQLWGAILQDLERRDRPLTLILDDLQCLTATSACDYLDQLLRFAPANLRLLAASEGQPRVPLSHLQRDARLLRIDAAELALDSEETRQLAALREVALDADAIYQLRAGSEGWISGVLLWLSAYRECTPAGQTAADLRPITRRAYVLARQFLEEERLLRLKPELRAFLEQTTVLPSFDIQLAQALSGRADAGEMLHRLQRLDLFIEARPGEPCEYRYHPALRGSLYQRLVQRAPQRLQQLHRQAGDWLLEQHRLSEAVYQFVRAHDYEAVQATVDRHSFDLLREGQVNTLIDFLAEVAGDAGGDSFALALTEASTLIVTNDVARLRRCISRLQGLLQRQAPARHPQRVQQTIAFLRCRLANLGGNLMHGLHLAERALQSFPQNNAASSVLHLERASGLAALGRLQSARAEAEQSLAELEGFGLSGYTSLPQLLLGQIELAQGAGDAAWQRFLRMERQQTASPAGSFYALFPELGKGLALLQANQIEQARHCLGLAESLALNFPHSAALPWVFHHQACLHWASGELRPARARWDEVRRLARQYCLFGLYRQAGAWRARLAVCEDDQDYLLTWLEEWHWCFRHYGENLQPEEWLAYAWVQRHLGQHPRAWQIHANLLELAENEQHLLLQLDLLLLEVSLLRDQGAEGEALITLDRALQLSCQFGFGQLLHHEGRTLHEGLRQLLLARTREQLGLSTPPPSRPLLEGLLRGLQPSAQPAGQPLADPLTRRELDVLQRMGRGQSNQQIAEAMFISLSTVKTHINNLFRKLDASDRDGAVRAARERELLH